MRADPWLLVVLVVVAAAVGAWLGWRASVRRRLGASVVKCCNVCWREVTLDDWQNGLTREPDPEEGVEARRCRCGNVLELDVTADVLPGEYIRHTGEL